MSVGDKGYITDLHSHLSIYKAEILAIKDDEVLVYYRTYDEENNNVYIAFWVDISEVYVTEKKAV